MSDAFAVERLPLIVAFSGGRTSGYMLRRYLDCAGGRVPPWMHVVFCNTGKERPETLDFVHEVEERWDVPVAWLEYRYADRKHTFAVVDYATASRDGRPFDEVINARPSVYLPNRISRYCTSELKVKTMWRWAKAAGIEEYTKAIGLRADEPDRLGRARGCNEERDEPLMFPGEDLPAFKKRRREDVRVKEHRVWPLADAGVTEADVLAFWRSQPFDLRLTPAESNCDLCFLKKKGQILDLMARRPDLAEWWIAKEAAGGFFRPLKDRPPYAALLRQAQQPRLFPVEMADEADEMCGNCTD